jgi:hypothetical protein
MPLDDPRHGAELIFDFQPTLADRSADLRGRKALRPPMKKVHAESLLPVVHPSAQGGFRDTGLSAGGG